MRWRIHSRTRVLSGIAGLLAVLGLAVPPVVGEGKPAGAEPGAGELQAGQSAAAQDAYAATIESWRQERRERLEHPDGWLTLVGLFWLPEGASTCGSDPGNALVFPAGAPARLGQFERQGSSVWFSAVPGTGATVAGETVTRAALKADTEGQPTVVTVGTFSFHLIERGGRFAVRLKDSASEVLRGFKGLEYFPIDASFRVEARFVPYDPPKPVRIPTILGTVEEQASPGALEFRLAGQDYRLDALPGGDGELFLVFADATSGKETYGGGRFIYTPAPDATHRVTLDFNQAFNPPCVFSPYATCPLPPPQNRLTLAVRAGEKNYAAGH